VTALILLIMSMAVVLVGIVLAQAALGQPTRIVTLGLRFPTGLEASAVEAFLTSLSGLTPTGWRRWVGTPAIGFEVAGDAFGIHHRVWMSERWRPFVERLLIAHLPNVAFTYEDHAARIELTVAAEYRLTSGVRPLAVDAASVSRSLLANMQPLAGGEQVIVQWVVVPAPAARPAEARSASNPMPAGALAALKRKQASPQLCAVGRIGAAAPRPGRSQSLLRRAEVAWHSSRAPGVGLRRRSLPTRWAVRRLSQRVVPIRPTRCRLLSGCLMPRQRPVCDTGRARSHWRPLPTLLTRHQ